MSSIREIDTYGNFTYWKDGEVHREDGPAVEFKSGGKQWWINGLLHNENGPAIIHQNGYKRWYINDIQLTEQEFVVWKLKNLLK